MKTTRLRKPALRAGSALGALVFAGVLIAPAQAQEAEEVGVAVAPGEFVDCETTPGDPSCNTQMIVVTGSILRSRLDNETARPLTVIDADQLSTRGVTTVDEAITNLSSNGAGTLPNSFTANGAFAAGASAVSLRGLTVSSTLVLFDGLRAAYYPLADDGTRNFVDLNTIPDAIVDRIEVLKDGASSTYGADAIAGVVNVITKRQVEGLHLGGEMGISERGDYGQQMIEATYGVGDLDANGFNVYVSGRYYHSDLLENADRRAPYNGDSRVLCNEDGTDCLPAATQLIVNTREFNGEFSGLSSLQANYLSRPYDPATGNPLGGYEQLDPDRPCPGNVITLTPEEQADNQILNSDTICEYDLYGQYGVIYPEQERINGSIRATFALSDTIEAYAMVNYARSDVAYEFYPAQAIRGSAPAASGITFTPSPLFLPIYICPEAQVGAGGDPTDNGCTAENGTLNPNNPYAAEGLEARILGNISERRESSRYKTDAYRASFGVTGTFGDDWFFDVGGTAMKVDLQRLLGGRVYIANFLQAVATGEYNFVNPEMNSEALLDFIAPEIDNRSTSEMYHLQGTVGRELFELPGGPVSVGIGASARHERVDAPGADADNSTDPDLVDPLQRYTSRVNPFGSKGERTVYSVFGEADVPVFDALTVNLAGRYDDYSTGQTAFSPKVGVEFRPIDQILLRGTWSKGFRIGSFAEFGATPTTGYITGTGTIPDELQEQYRLANGGTLPTYISSYSLGLTTAGNPSLQPERSESWTAGIAVEPFNGLSFTVDYFRIKKTDLITGADYTGAVEAYYAGQPIPEGFTVTPDEAAVGDEFAGLLPRIAFVQYSFTNKDSGLVEGIDFAAAGVIPLTDGITFRSSLEATYLMELSQTVDGVKQEYQGSIGPYVITSGAGSPVWRGSWQNTLEFDGGFYISATAYYTDAYSTSAEDASGEGTRTDCAESLAAHYLVSGDAYQCSVDSYTSVNLSTGFTVNDSAQLYFNVNNLFDKAPPIDTATYGGLFYNPAYHATGIIGRYFKIGAKLNF